MYFAAFLVKVARFIPIVGGVLIKWFQRPVK